MGALRRLQAVLAASSHEGPCPVAISVLSEAHFGECSVVDPTETPASFLCKSWCLLTAVQPRNPGQQGVTYASCLTLEELVGRTVQAGGGYLLPLSPGGDLSSCPCQVLETCVKNCGHRFHVLVANRDFIDSVLVKVISPKNSPPTIVQDKVLALIQVGRWPWASPTSSVKAPGPCLPTASLRPPPCSGKPRLVG